MKTAIIIHGSGDNSKKHWFPWLKGKLESIGYTVFVPDFPVPEEDIPGGHHLDEWMDTFKKYRKHLNKDTVLVGHSRGCIFLYNLLQQLETPVHATFLVAPWIEYHWYPEGWTEIDSFHKTPFNWEKIRQGSRYIEVFQSTNDEMPVSEGTEVAEKLNATLTVVKDAKHFSATTMPEFKQFPLLFEHIQKIQE